MRGGLRECWAGLRRVLAVGALLQCSSCAAQPCVFTFHDVDGTTACVDRCDGLNFSVGRDCFRCDAVCAGGCFGSGPDLCVTCANTSFVNGTCVTRCPHGWYSNGSDAGRCHPCHRKCDGCFGGRATHCVACRVASFLGACVDACPANSFVDASDAGVCLPCAQECSQTCTGPSERECTTLNGTTGPEACAHNLRAGACVPSCSAGREYASGSGECFPCSDQCAATGNGGCSGPTASECSACATVRLGSMCLSSCPTSSHYLGLDNGTCMPCDESCQRNGLGGGCTGPGPEQCHSCATFFRRTHQGAIVCAHACTHDEFVVTTIHGRECRACDTECAGGCAGPSAAECTRCRSFLHSNGTCVPTCPISGNIVSLSSTNTSICTPCAAQCDTVDADGFPLPIGCTTPEPQDCARCSSVRHPILGCAEDCGPGYYNHSVAVTTTADFACSPCSALCDRRGACEGPLASDCDLCTVARFRGACVSACPPRTYQSTPLSGRDAECHECHGECQGSCTGPGDDACSGGLQNACVRHALPTLSGVRCVPQCPHLFWSNRTTCQTCSPACSAGGASGCSSSEPSACMCPVGQFWNAATLQCEACDRECDELGCDGAGPLHCFSCHNFQLPNHRCVAACPAMHFNDSGGGCYPCSQACNNRDGCTGPSHDDCFECPGRAFFNMSSLACQACHGTCEECVGGARSMDCTRCAPDASWLGSQCVFDCPLTHFSASADNGNRVCELCHESCSSEGCVGPDEAGCRRCDTNLRNGSSGACMSRTADPISSSCPRGMYLGQHVDSPQEHWLDNVCWLCHSECAACTNGSLFGCTECSSVLGRDGVCATNCVENELILYRSGVATCTCPDDIAYVETLAPTTATTTTHTSQTTTTTTTESSTTATSTSSTITSTTSSLTSTTALIGLATTAAGPNATIRSTAPGTASTPAATARSMSTTVSASAVETATGASIMTAPSTISTAGYPQDAQRPPLSTCRRCHSECLGCFGPTDTQCRQCRHFSRRGRCISSCFASEVPDTLGECHCRLNFYRQRGVEECQPCHDLCREGCTVGGPSGCTACAGPWRTVDNLRTCVNHCSILEAVDDVGQCAQCSEACFGGCSRPQDPTACVGLRRCRRFLSSNASMCIRNCPVDQPFVVEENADLRCASACPSSHPFFNDTGEVMPQRCVRACIELGPAKIYVSPSEPHRCSTLEQLAEQSTESSSSGSSDDTVPLHYLALAFLGIVVLFVITVCCIVRFACRPSKGKHTVTNPVPNAAFSDPSPWWLRPGGLDDEDEDVDEPDDAQTIIQGFGSKSPGFSLPQSASQLDAVHRDESGHIERLPSPWTPVTREWTAGKRSVEVIPRGPRGLGLKLDENFNGDVFITRTSKGSTAEEVLGSSECLGNGGLRILSVQGKEFRGKSGCLSVIKAAGDAVEFEVLCEDREDRESGAASAAAAAARAAAARAALPEVVPVDMGESLTDAVSPIVVESEPRVANGAPSLVHEATESQLAALEEPPGVQTQKEEILEKMRVGDARAQFPEIEKTWEPGRVANVSVPKGPNGVGMKLKQRHDGVFVIRTTPGSTSEEVLGSTPHLGESGLRIISVQGKPVLSKVECVKLVKSAAHEVQLEVVLDPNIGSAASAIPNVNTELPQGQKPPTSHSAAPTEHPPALGEVVVRRRRIGKVYVDSVPRGKKGLGIKLEERDDGAVYAVKTVSGSTSEKVLGSTKFLGPRGLRILKVQGNQFSGKSGCLALIKSVPPDTDVQFEVVAEHIPVNKGWAVGHSGQVKVRQPKNGLGVKLIERASGAVYIIETSRGSTAELALGSTAFLGPSGLRVRTVFGTVVRSKTECATLLKSRPQAKFVELEFAVEA